MKTHQPIAGSPALSGLLVALGVLAGTTVASAQSTCGPDQTVVDAAGHCCAAGQNFSTSLGVCVPALSATAASTLQSLAISGALTPPKPPGAVSLTFVPERPTDHVTLQIQPLRGAPTTCTAPCVVDVPPGYLGITATGSRAFQTGLDVPYLPTTYVVNHDDPQVGAVVTGSLMTATGVAGTIAGAVFLAEEPQCVTGPFASGDACRAANNQHTAMGVVGLAVGIPLVLSGGVVLLTAAAHHRRLLSPMSPGEMLHRPIAQNGPDVRLTGLSVAPLARGAMVGASVSF